MKDLSANSIDCFICDLPYGCLIGGPAKEKGGCLWDVPLDLDALWTQIKRLAKDEHTPVLMFCTTKFGYDLIKSNERWFRYDLVWDKGRGVSFLSANKMPMRSHEMIYVFSKAGARYERVDISGNFAPWVGSHSSSKVYNLTKPDTEGYKKGHGEGKRCALSVISNLKITKHGGHPTEKPLDLYKWLIERYCPPGGTLLDPTAGSFNSCFAAQALGRHAIGIEKDETFFKKAVAKVE